MIHYTLEARLYRTKSSCKIIGSSMLQRCFCALKSSDVFEPTSEPISTFFSEGQAMQQASELEQLKSMTVVVADTGDIDVGNIFLL